MATPASSRTMRGQVAALLLAAALPGLGLAAQGDKPKNPKHDVEAIGERDVGKGVNFYSIEKEIALGRKLAAEVERTSRLVDDPVVAEYVNRIGQNLVRHSDAKVPFTIKVIDNDQVNAFALPGGFFFVHSGLVLLAANEAELAGVMAHEIAHVAARHGTRQASRGQLAGWASLPLIFLGGGVGYAVNQAAGLALPITFLKFSRGFEKEADLLGVQYLYNAGYDPAAMVTFFERIQRQEKSKPGSLAKVFSTHPMTQDRIKETQKSIDRLLPAKKEYAVSTSEFDGVKDRLVRIQGLKGQRPDRPALRRKPAETPIPAETERRGEGSDSDERPTLKKR